MKTLVAVLLFVIVGLASTIYVQSRTISKLNAEVAEVPSLRLAKATLIADLNEANDKFASTDLSRQFAEHGENRWETVIKPLYTPAIVQRLKPVSLPDGTQRIVWPNPHDLPYLLAEYCATRR